MGISENLRRLRQARSLSQRALGDLAGVSQQLISQIERGENAATKELAAIARALGVPASDIDPEFEVRIAAPTQFVATNEAIASYVGFDPATVGRRFSLIADAGFPRLWERIGTHENAWREYVEGRRLPEPNIFSAIVIATGLADTFVRMGYPAEMTEILLERKARLTTE